MPFNANAHVVVVDEHVELIPIPAYSQPYGESGAEAALKGINALLNSFDDHSKASFMFELDAQQRSYWSNLPAGIVDRYGISVGDMSDEQRKLLFEFLASALGKAGYQKMGDILAAEAFLSPDKRAKRLKWAPENYWFSIYGAPAKSKNWGWQFGGHHLALNISIEDNVVESMSPSFIGTEPALFNYKDVDYRVVVDMHEEAFAVFNQLSASQQKKANAGEVPKDVIAGPGNDGVITGIIEVSAAEMSAEQRKLLAAISKWVEVEPNKAAQIRLQKITQQLDQTYFAFTGANDVTTPTYMRIQGPSLIIELLSTGGNVGVSAKGQGHYHTIYRHLGQDYGGEEIQSSGMFSFKRWLNSIYRLLTYALSLA